MSLRFRLNLLITLVFIAIFATGTVLLIHHARQAVADETRSTAELTSELLDLAFIQTNPENQVTRQFELMRQLKAFAIEHHLHVEIIHGKDVQPFDLSELVQYQSSAPAWFVKLVEPTSIVLRQPVLVAGMPYSELIIRPDPADEISEAWNEIRLLLGMFTLFFLIAIVLVFIFIGRTLKTIDQITHALDGIEQGDFQARLGDAESSEFKKITSKFNNMAEALDKSREQNRYLSQQAQKIQEEERRHLSRELHDEMGQSISAIKVLAVTIKNSSDNEQITTNATTISEISSHVYNVVRGMMKRLHPAVLDELGLLPALNDLIDSWNDHHQNLFCHFDYDLKTEKFPKDIEITIYRMVQECLTNITKHAKAKNVYIRLTQKESWSSTTTTEAEQLLELTVEDDGQGFNKSIKQGHLSGLGLHGMRERAEGLGGSFMIDSTLGTGTQIRVNLPLAQEKLN